MLASNILHVLIFHLEKPLSVSIFGMVTYAFPLANFKHSFATFSSVSIVDLEHLNISG